MTRAAYRQEIGNRVGWCRDNNLELNVDKTKEIIVDFRRRRETSYEPVFNDGVVVERVQQFRFLGTIIRDINNREQSVQTQ